MTDVVEITTASTSVVEEVTAVATTTKPEAVVEEPLESDSEYETDDDEDEGPGLASLLQDVRAPVRSLGQPWGGESLADR